MLMIAAVYAQTRFKKDTTVFKYKRYVTYGSRTIAPEANYPPVLILTLTPNQTLTLTGVQFSSGAIIRTL